MMVTLERPGDKPLCSSTSGRLGRLRVGARSAWCCHSIMGWLGASLRLRQALLLNCLFITSHTSTSTEVHLDRVDCWIGVGVAGIFGVAPAPALLPHAF